MRLEQFLWIGAVVGLCASIFGPDCIIVQGTIERLSQSRSALKLSKKLVPLSDRYGDGKISLSEARESMPDGIEIASLDSSSDLNSPVEQSDIQMQGKVSQLKQSPHRAEDESVSMRFAQKGLPRSPMSDFSDNAAWVAKSSIANGQEMCILCQYFVQRAASASQLNTQSFSPFSMLETQSRTQQFFPTANQDRRAEMSSVESHVSDYRKASYNSIYQVVEATFYRICEFGFPPTYQVACNMMKSRTSQVATGIVQQFSASQICYSAGRCNEASYIFRGIHGAEAISSVKQSLNEAG